MKKRASEKKIRNAKIRCGGMCCGLAHEKRTTFFFFSTDNLDAINDTEKTFTMVLPTFRLFVQHGRPLYSLQEERELRALFETHGKIASFSTKKNWCNSLVTFTATHEAIAARQALDVTRFNGERLKILFTRPTRRVLVRGLSSLEDARKLFPRAVTVERDIGSDFVVVFESIRDAEQALELANASEGGRELSFDFGNDSRENRRATERERSPRPRSRSPVRRSRSRSRSCPLRRYSREHSRSKSVRRSQSPLRRNSPERSMRKSRSRSKSRPLRKRSRSPEQSLSSPRISASPLVVNAADPVVPDDGSFRDCSRLLGELTTHVKDSHSPGPLANQKAVVLAWFECHYTKKEEGGGAGENPVYVSRSTILNELNALLASMGWPKWKAQSALYRDWFLREVMGLDDDDIRKGRNWSLYRKDGFAPGSNVKNARSQQQRMDELVAGLKKYMGL